MQEQTMMKNSFPLSFRPWLYITGVLLAITTTPAHAVYTVIDDDLMPTAPTEQPAAPIHATIPFYKEHSPLATTGKATLDALIPQLRNATAIKIIGRPDARAYAQGKIADLARNRAINIRNYLTRAGVSGNIIAIEVDNSPNPQSNGSVYPCDLYISTANTSAAPQPVQYQQSSYQPTPPVFKQTVTQNFYPTAPAAQPAYAPLSIEITAPRAPQQPAQPASASTDQVMNFINRAVQSGQMAIDVALKLIRRLIESENSNTSDAYQQARNPAPVAYAPAPAVAQPTNALGLSAAPDTVRAQEWTLTPDKTLKDNIEAWAARVNYTLKWNAKNPYRVGRTSTLPGDLFDVIDRVATTVGVDMSVSHKTRTIYINDK